MRDELERAGLDVKEARLYLAVLEAQHCSVAEAAASAGITRTSAYDVAKKLMARGLIAISEERSAGGSVLSANDPGILLDEWSQRKHLLDDLVPRLRAMRGDGLRQPRVRFLPGEIGIHSALFETLNWPGPLRGIFSMRDLLTVPGPAATQEYIDARIAAGLHLRVIRSAAREEGPRWPTGEEYLRETRYAPEAYVFTMTILIGADRVAVMSSRREDFAMIIESPEYADTQASLFEALWGLSTEDHS